jgi:hypothetical protein
MSNTCGFKLFSLLGTVIILCLLGMPRSARASSVSLTGSPATPETDFEQGFSLSPLLPP